VNKVKNPPKEKIIQGDLDFNSKNVHHNRIPNTQKQKKNRGKPTKSPIPVPKDHRLPANYQKLFNNHHQSNGLFKPKSAFPRKNNFMNNMNVNNSNNINKNISKPSYLGINSNFSSNKTYNAFNVFKKKLERTQSPLITSGANRGINFLQKGPVKSRYVSKSPILSKGCIFNRYKMNIIGGMNNTPSTNSSSNNKKIKKKTPIKNNTNNKKPLINNKPNYMNHNVNNINNIKGKGPTLIQGEFVQDAASNGKISINNINQVVKRSVNINPVNPINPNNQMNPLNFKPIYNSQNLKIESNNALLNIHPEPNIKEKERDVNLYKKNKEINENNTSHNKANNENTNNSNINVNNQVNLINQNQNEPRKILKETKKDINSNNNSNNNINNTNIKKNNQRSQSTGITNPLQKQTNEKEDKVKEKEKETQQPPIKIKKEKEKEKKKEISKEKEETPKPKYITKKIKDILPYTHVGFDGEEPKENNQDNYFIYKNFMDRKDYIYMSVCDGHGIEGHFVSDFMKEILPYDMSENLKNCNLMTENEKERDKIHQIIKETFIIANEKLVYNEEINSLFSGSTCVSVIYTPEKLIVPNIGDSRAVLGRLINKEKNEYKAINLSRDHKPTEKDEAKRIIENDGRIQPFTEDGEFVGPERVWIKEEEVPGLAMTRSFGDRVAATVGVMSEPEIKEFTYEEGDKFMIIASDGIWEFISSQECVDIIKNFYDKNDLKGCCEYLYQESSKRWLKEEEVIDDTTMILVFFE
jgi:serine/threonine protein phosphatase PrpC